MNDAVALRSRRWLPHGRGLPEDVWRKRHLGILILLWAHVAGIPVYALVQGFDLGHGLLEASIVAAPAAFATWPGLGRRIHTIAASLGILFSSAVLVHLSGGVIEMHFHFFVMVTVVALYQDWVPFLLAIAYVLIHHGVMGVVDPNSVYNHPAAVANPWKWAAVHAFFISGISAVCLVTWKLNETLVSLRRRAETEKAQLYDAERVARRDAESAQERLEILAEASRTMTSALDPARSVENIAGAAVPSFCDVCLIDILQDDGSVRRVAKLSSEAAELIAEPPPHRTLSQSGPIARALRQRGAVVEDLAPKDFALSLLPDADISQVVTAISVPLLSAGTVIGVLTFLSLQEARTRWSDRDVDLAEELARRAEVALEHASLYAAKRDIAHTLQQSLIPRRLPEVPGLASVARYLPGGPGVDVGGDWYDLFVLPGGNIGIAMGDVMGRGVHAASLMGQLRNALRAFAFEGLEPAEVLNKLHRLVESDDSEYLATAIYAVLSLDTLALRIANAAHPPPLVSDSEGFARLIEDGVAPPLGAVAHTRYEQTTVRLDEGETLLLYTDGLIEDRETSLEDGLIRLTAALQNSPEKLSDFPDHLLSTALAGRAADDDVAFLVLRMATLGDRLSMRVPVDARLLAPLRAVLRRWFEKNGLSEPQAFDALVACGEACTNAIEHGAEDGQGYFELEATAGEEISVIVRSDGAFRTVQRSNRGRGLNVMEALSYGVKIAKSASDTEVRLRFHRVPDAPSVAAAR